MEAPAPPEPSRIDGLTDEEWAARRIRSEVRLRFLFGLGFGLAVAALAIWHWGFLVMKYRFAAAFVAIGSVILFPMLFARRRDAEAFGLAGWIVFAEWKAVERMPWWLMMALAASLFAVTFFFGAVLVLGRLPWF
jgi:hypothetical protein